MKLDYTQINARAVNSLLATKKHLSSIDAGLTALIELRVSLINGCSYCIDKHANEARAAGMSRQRLDCVSVARESGLFSPREVAALRWAEEVTNLSASPGMENGLNRLLEHFSEAEAVDLTLTISLMNCLNRMAISFSDRPTAQDD